MYAYQQYAAVTTVICCVCQSINHKHSAPVMDIRIWGSGVISRGEKVRFKTRFRSSKTVRWTYVKEKRIPVFRRGHIESSRGKRRSRTARRCLVNFVMFLSHLIICTTVYSYRISADAPARRRLRSTDTMTLQVPSTRRSTIGDRAFPVAAARAWNSLSTATRTANSLLQFRRETRARLFRQSFLDRTKAVAEPYQLLVESFLRGW